MGVTAGCPGLAQTVEEAPGGVLGSRSELDHPHDLDLGQMFKWSLSPQALYAACLLCPVSCPVQVGPGSVT